MNTEIKYGLVGLLVGGIAVWMFTSGGFTPNNTGMMGRSNTVQNSSDKIDSHFIEQMIPHHEDAITMAELALTKGTRPEVKELAANIIDSQGKEINQMKDWYKDWFEKDLPVGDEIMNQHGMMDSAKQNSMHMGMMGDETDMTSLKDSSDFDRAFVEEMIPHHQMAVMMANMLKGSTQRPEMKNLSAEIITAQTREIDQMRQWLRAW